MTIIYLPYRNFLRIKNKFVWGAMNKHTRSKVQDYIQQENSIRHRVKCYPRRAHVVVEKSNGYWQDKHVHDQQRQDHQVPV